MAGQQPDGDEQQEDEQDELAPQLDKPREAFSQDQLDSFYQNFVEQLKEQNKPRIVATLSNKSPKISKDENTVLILENKTQETYFQEIKRDLVRFLRSKLNNYSLIIDTKIVAGSQQTEPYSPEEKYQYLLKKNPHLAELRDKLNLDLE